MRLNQDTLASRNVLYIGNLRSISGSHSDYARRLQDSSEQDYQQAISQMESLISNAGDQILIYSNESHYATQKVLHAYKEAIKGIPLQVIFYLRSQDQWIQAHYMQSVLSAPVREFQTILEFIRRQNLRYSRLISLYEKIFGAQSLSPRVYDSKYFVGGNIFSDFMNSINLPFDATMKLPAREQSNLSRSRLFIEILRIANANKPKKSHAANILRIQKFLGDSGIKSGMSNYSFLTDRQRLDLMSDLADSNASIARRYFNRESDTLFNVPEVTEGGKEAEENSFIIHEQALTMYNNIFG